MASILVEKLFVTKKEGSNILAYADIAIAGKIKIFGCKLIKGETNNFIGYPSQKGKDDKWYGIVKVLDETLNAEIYSAIAEQYEIDTGNQSSSSENSEQEPF